MDVTQIYLSSPDWLKLVWILTPYVTVYGIALVMARASRRDHAAFYDTSPLIPLPGPSPRFSGEKEAGE